MPDHARDDMADEAQPSIACNLTGTTVTTQTKTHPPAQQKKKKRKCQERPELCFSGGRLKTSHGKNTSSNLQDVCTSTNVMTRQQERHLHQDRNGLYQKMEGSQGLNTGSFENTTVLQRPETVVTQLNLQQQQEWERSEMTQNVRAEKLSTLEQVARGYGQEILEKQSSQLHHVFQTHQEKKQCMKDWPDHGNQNLCRTVTTTSLSASTTTPPTFKAVVNSKKTVSLNPCEADVRLIFSVSDPPVSRHSVRLGCSAKGLQSPADARCVDDMKAQSDLYGGSAASCSQRAAFPDTTPVTWQHMCPDDEEPDDACSQTSVSLLQPRSPMSPCLFGTGNKNTEYTAAPICGADTAPPEVSQETTQARLQVVSLQSAPVTPHPAVEKGRKLIAALLSADGNMNAIVTTPHVNGVTHSSCPKPSITASQNRSQPKGLLKVVQNNSQSPCTWPVAHNDFLQYTSPVTGQQNKLSVSGPLHMSQLTGPHETLPLSGLQRSTTRASLRHTSISSDIPACSETPTTGSRPRRSCRQKGNPAGNGSAPGELHDDFTKRKSSAKSDEIPRLSVFAQSKETVAPCDENHAYTGRAFLLEALASFQISTSDAFGNQTLSSPALSRSRSSTFKDKRLGADSVSSIPPQAVVGADGYAMFSKTMKGGLKHPKTASITMRVSRRKTGRSRRSYKSRAPKLQADFRTCTKSQNVNGRRQKSTGWTTSQKYSAPPVSAITTGKPQPSSETETTAQQTGACALPKGFLLPESAVSSKQVRPAINNRGVALCDGVSLGHTQACVDLISSVRSVLLVADEELAWHSDHSDLRRFWEADFTNVTMSPATWATVDIWE